MFLRNNKVNSKRRVHDFSFLLLTTFVVMLFISAVVVWVMRFKINDR